MPEPVTAEELHQRVQARRGRDLGDLTEYELRRWLIDAGFAFGVGDRLTPTPLARRIGGTLTAVERDSGRDVT